MDELNEQTLAAWERLRFWEVNVFVEPWAAQQAIERIPTLIVALRTAQARVEALEKVADAARAVYKAEYAPDSPYLPVGYSLAIVDLCRAVRALDGKKEQGNAE